MKIDDYGFVKNNSDNYLLKENMKNINRGNNNKRHVLHTSKKEARKKGLFTFLALFLIVFIFFLVSAIKNVREINTLQTSIDAYLKQEKIHFSEFTSSLLRKDEILEKTVSKFMEMYQIQDNRYDIYIDTNEGHSTVFIDKSANEAKVIDQFDYNEYIEIENPTKEYNFFQKLKVKKLKDKEKLREIENLKNIAREKNLVIDFENIMREEKIEVLKDNKCTIVRFTNGLPIVVYEKKLENETDDNLRDILNINLDNTNKNKNDNNNIKEEFKDVNTMIEDADEKIILYKYYGVNDLRIRVPDLNQYYLIP